MDDEIRRIVEAERGRLAEAVARRTERLAHARDEARRLAARFAEAEPSLRRVILFGSVTTGRPRSDRFDIDLAVDADRLGELLCIADESELPVDLVDLQSVSSSLRRVIEERGAVLYESRA